jgi:hypothetical protein
MLNMDTNVDNYAQVTPTSWKHKATGAFVAGREGQSLPALLSELSQPTVEDPNPVPGSISPLQARKALTRAGMRGSVDAYVAKLDQDSKDAWEYATVVHRDNPIIAAGAKALALTPAQVDDLFRLGATL